MNRIDKMSVSQKNTRSTSKLSRRKFTPISSSKKGYSSKRNTPGVKRTTKAGGKKGSSFKKIESKELKKELIGKSKRGLFDFYCFTNQDQSAKLVPLGDSFDEKVIESAICDFVNGVLLISLRDLLGCLKRKNENSEDTNSCKERNLILLTRILSQIDDKYSITLLSKSQFKELEQYLVDFMIPYHSYKSKVLALVQKTLSREDAESLATKLTGQSMVGQGHMYNVLERIYEVKGIEKMMAFVFVQIIESFDIPFNIYMTEIRAAKSGKKKKKVKFYDCMKSMDVKDQGVFILLKVTKGFIFYYGSKNVAKEVTQVKAKSYKSVDKHMSIRDLDLEISTNAETCMTYNNIESSKNANSSKISLTRFRRTGDMLVSNCQQSSHDMNLFSKRDMIIGSSMDSDRFAKEKDKAANSTKRVAVCLKEGANFNRSFDAPKRNHAKWQKDVLKRNSFIELYGKSARSMLKNKFSLGRDEKENSRKQNKVVPGKKKRKTTNRNPLDNSKSSKKGCISIEGSSNKNRSFNSSFMKLFSDKSQINFKKKTHSKRKRRKKIALKENNLNVTDFSQKIKDQVGNPMKSFDENSASKTLSQKMKAILSKKYDKNGKDGDNTNHSFNKKAGKTQALIQKNQQLIENLIEKYDVKKVTTRFFNIFIEGNKLAYQLQKSGSYSTQERAEGPTRPPGIEINKAELKTKELLQQRKAHLRRRKAG